MSKGKAPKAPDYVGAANAQAEASKEVTNIQNYANRPTINTPFGSESWSNQASIDPATGQRVTSWTQNTTLAPGLQAALDAQVGTQLGRSNLANDFMGRVAGEYSKPFDWQNLPEMARMGGAPAMNTQLADYSQGLSTGLGSDAPALPQFDSSYRDTVAQSLMERMMPVHDRQKNQIETQLANAGYTVGSEGYTRALADMQGRQAAERYNALDTAGNEAQRLYGMQMGSRQQALGELGFGNQALGQAASMDQSRMGAMNQAMGQQFGMNQQLANQQNQLRQQAIAEQMQRRGMSLNEMNALLSGQQVNMPQMPNFVQAGRSETPNILGATQMGYDAQLGAYNAKQAGLGNMMGGLFSLGASAMAPGAGSLFGFGG